MLKQDKTVIQITLFFFKKKNFYYDSFILFQDPDLGETANFYNMKLKEKIIFRKNY